MEYAISLETSFLKSYSSKNNLKQPERCFIVVAHVVTWAVPYS